MSCGCQSCECEALREQIDSLQEEKMALRVQLEALIRIDDHRRSAEKAMARQLVEARGTIGERGYPE